MKELTTAHPYHEARTSCSSAPCATRAWVADALAAYEGVRRVLQEGLVGADPGRELRRLHTELLDPAGAGGWGPYPWTPTIVYGGKRTGRGRAQGEAVASTSAPAKSDRLRIRPRSDTSPAPTPAWTPNAPATSAPA